MSANFDVALLGLARASRARKDPRAEESSFAPPAVQIALNLASLMGSFAIGKGRALDQSSLHFFETFFQKLLLFDSFRVDLKVSQVFSTYFCQINLYILDDGHIFR